MGRPPGRPATAWRGQARMSVFPGPRTAPARRGQATAPPKPAYGVTLEAQRVLGTREYLEPPTRTQPVGFLTTDLIQRSLQRTQVSVMAFRVRAPMSVFTDPPRERACGGKTSAMPAYGATPRGALTTAYLGPLTRAMLASSKTTGSIPHSMRRTIPRPERWSSGPSAAAATVAQLTPAAIWFVTATLPMQSRWTAAREKSRSMPCNRRITG